MPTATVGLSRSTVPWYSIRHVGARIRSQPGAAGRDADSQRENAATESAGSSLHGEPQILVRSGQPRFSPEAHDLTARTRTSWPREGPNHSTRVLFFSSG